ncbi:tRNA (adenosine(37)-N6)-threonylcarbamoyltransferase complex ATPase subunit type 1 TsaE [Candidatus Aerophobetes bacterium]|uniref:tRNA threonylcarbamoyladenosine biosynthesis protein TsaE n=1 Tax=Aerophobetes bacterium TaxID=2030807 RepID=A0A2A4WZI4_UNCAE|nr:MAG: tRNA (adenosine(37)-N6)-threonylcarbamoyltransferase complex ATPase subunit type 1 TsaE [Candidatus Aerophobetes bacterium]
MPQHALVSSCSLHEIDTIAEKLLHLAQENSSIFAFYGPLGAGKTTLVKKIIAIKANICPSSITSPTFTYVQTYGNSHPIHHFDLYRIKTAESFESMGFTDYLDQTCLIEWPEVIEKLLPKNTIRIHIAYAGQESRTYKIELGKPLVGESIA